MEVFIITLGNKELVIKTIEETYQLLYEIYDNGERVGILNIDERGFWQCNNNYPETLIKEIGNLIEQHDV